MTKAEYIENIKLELGCYGSDSNNEIFLQMELSDSQLGKVVDRALLEVQKYIDSTKLMTVPFARCINLEGTPVSSILRVYRAEGLNGSAAESGGQTTVMDPMYVQTWMAFTNGGTMYNLNDYLLNYLSYSTLMQMRNTTSTDMAWKQDHTENKLYINDGFDAPKAVTIEYVPKYSDVNEIVSDYWIDILLRLSVALTKQILGRIRTRYKSSSNLWEQDGETLLSEATEELKDLREKLRVNSQIILPID